MNAVSNDAIKNEGADTEVVHGAERGEEEGLVELGAVSETRGGIGGSKGDTGNGWQFF